MFNHNKAHYGYFSVGDLKTFSKTEALELHVKTGHAIQYHFNDEVYSSYDWSVEPAESVQELYFKRARQIREKYDYLILLFSGGADSYNVLMSFVHAGVKVDEIAHYTYMGAEKDKTSFQNREIFETAYPTALKLKETNPLFRDTVIREIDLTEITDAVMKHNLYDFTYYGNALPSPWQAAKSYIREMLPAYKKLCSEKKVAFVHGAEKVNHIRFEKGKFYFNFHEVTSSEVNSRVQEQNRPEENDEFFYSTPDAPLIHIKQCHLIKNFLINAQVPHPWLTSTAPNSFGHVPKWYDNQWQTFWLTTVGLHSIVYPWYDPSLYVERKIQNMIYSDRDRWVFDHPEYSVKYNNYVKSMTERFGSTWLHNPFPGRYHTGHYYSKSYCLS